ncbi:MAG: efflux RND transporter periplasmic adaptor subunit [Methylococcaceae bacterium]|nr:efflux RND transporter periplasmic adaptor subunit [Methylococcaceae bacterium]
MKRLLSLTLAAALVAAAYLWWPQADHQPAERYKTQNLDRGDIQQVISANGTLNPVVLVNVGTQVSGTIQRLHADFNDVVSAGQVLAELDPALFQAQLAQSRGTLANARAALKLAQANERRARDLFGKDYIARSELDQAVQALESARAQVSGAEGQVKRDQTNLDYSVIRSPVSGVVISRNVDVGQTVAASFQTPTLFSIAQDLKQMQIYTTVAEAAVGGIREGLPARFNVDAFADREFQGKVRQVRLNPQIQQNVVTYNVVVEVDNRDEILLPGMTAFVRIVVDERRNVLRLPLAALRFRPEGATGPKRAKGGEKNVYRLAGNQPQPAPVRTGIADGNYAEVVGNDWHEGDAVIVEDLREPKKDAAKNQQPGGFRLRAF